MGDINELGEVLNSIKGPVAIYSTVGIFLLILLFVFLKKEGKKSKELSRKEMTYYLDNAFSWAEAPKKLSGNIVYNGNSVYYSRGTRTSEFKILVEAETILAPCMIREWFSGRNYSKREEETILNDLKLFLEENRYANSVSIVSDKEYNLILDEAEAYSEDTE